MPPSSVRFHFEFCMKGSTGSSSGNGNVYVIEQFVRLLNVLDMTSCQTLKNLICTKNGVKKAELIV